MSFLLPIATDTMPTGPVTWGQLTLIFVGIALLQGLIKFGDRLWLERKEKKNAETTPPALILPNQSTACGIQHSQIAEAMRSQTESFKETSKMLQNLANVIREQAHAEEVRSQGLAMRMDLLLQGQNELRRDR